MLFTVKNHNLFNANPTVTPQLSRVWIKTGNPKMPLKSVWIDERALCADGVKSSILAHESETQELTEDHLALAA